MMAIPLMLKLERYGHRTPRDYSIIGFDDSPMPTPSTSPP